MNTNSYIGDFEIIAIGFEPGEMLLESIREVIKKHDIVNGAVISGIGTLKNANLHHIEHTNFPPDNHFFNIEKPLELVSVNGLIANGEPHLHVALTCGENEAFGGHLEDGSEVLYLAEIEIMKHNGLKMKRVYDEKRQISLMKGLEE